MDEKCRHCTDERGGACLLNVCKKITRKYPQEFYDRAKKQLADINQFFNDIDHWNNNHPTEKVNPDPDGQLRMLKRNMETILKS